MALYILSRSAQMPLSCWGSYKHVAVIEAEDGVDPDTLAIDTRRKAVVRIVWQARKLHVGKTSRCAYQRALAEARALFPEAIES